MYKSNRFYPGIIGCLVLISMNYLMDLNTFAAICPNNFIYSFDVAPEDSVKYIEISGTIKNNFQEPVDSVEITGHLKSGDKTVFSDYEGRYKIKVSKGDIDGDSLRLSYFRPDYYFSDTVLNLTRLADYKTLSVILFPKYKILLKGRLFAGSDPVSEVLVTVTHLTDTQFLRTLGCYYDDENYWNCLYNGMFKTEIITENPDDSIYLSFSKYGFKPQSYQLKFADYSGDIIKFKMKYADSIPDLPNNNLGFKISNPLGGDWYMGLSFYGKFNYKKLNRFRPGLEISLLTINQSITLITLPGADDTKFDTVYNSFFAGPSFLFYITKPHIRKLSTYLGSTFSLAFNGGNFVYQPFVGTRFFIDMRKSISIDLRYINFKLGVKEYTYVYNGNALSSTKEIGIEKIIFNLGFQINF